MSISPYMSGALIFLFIGSFLVFLRMALKAPIREAESLDSLDAQIERIVRKGED